MKIMIGIGSSIIILLCGCAEEERLHSTSHSDPPSHKKLSHASSDNSDQVDKKPDLIAIDNLSRRIDDGVRRKLYSKRFFGGFLANPEATQLDWKKFKNEQQRSSTTGYPDTNMNAWLENDKILYVSSERGMTSGVGWRERSKYYFRADGTLSKLIFSDSPGVGAGSRKLVRYYSQQGSLLHSSTSFDTAATVDSLENLRRREVLPEVYRRTKSLPIYRLLKINKGK